MFTLNNGKTVGSIHDDDKYLLSKLLINTMKELGHPPSFEEVKKQENMPKNPNIYAIYFGSLEKACKEAECYVESAKKLDGHIIIGHEGAREHAKEFMQRRPYARNKN